MKKAIVVLNEQHTLLEEQESVLNETFEEWEIFPVPAEGWKAEQILGKYAIGPIAQEVLSHISKDERGDAVVFASPVPLLIKVITQCSVSGRSEFRVKIFHSDKREKKEFDGRIISVVAKTGWKLV